MKLHLFASVACLSLATAAGCGDDSSSSSSAGGGGSGGSGGASTSGTGGTIEQTGAACETAAECYPGVADGALSGEAICLDRAQDGYCTHACEVDEDCCAAEGECATDVAQVCAPFESTDQRMCFLSCESEDLGGRTEAEHCQLGAGRDFICRSTGGGSDNRKVCFPGDCGVGAACDADHPCPGGLDCVTGLLGGYCSAEGCTSSDACPEGSRCVSRPGAASVCLRTCEVATDCSFCRGDQLAATCTDQADFVDGSPTPVCVPAEG